jgi:hypothetical protein
VLSGFSRSKKSRLKTEVVDLIREAEMKKILPTLAVCVLFSAASLAKPAQQTPSTEHSAPAIQQDSQPASMARAANKGDRTVKGCLRSSGGKYTLEGKHQKPIWLTGSEDLSSHVGHLVVVHGSFISSTEAPSGGQAHNFQVKQVDMVADRCNQTGNVSNKHQAPADQK